MADVVERLRAAINLGDRTGSRGKSASNIYNVADDALAEIEALRARLSQAGAGGGVVLWPIETDDQVEALARECEWDNRIYMTPADYAIWCERMRKFARLAALAPSPSAGEPVAIKGLRAVCDANGKRWRIEAEEGWTMQPEGYITASQAGVICRTVIAALDALTTPPTPVQPTASVEAVAQWRWADSGVATWHDGRPPLGSKPHGIEQRTVYLTPAPGKADRARKIIHEYVGQAASAATSGLSVDDLEGIADDLFAALFEDTSEAQEPCGCLTPKPYDSKASEARCPICDGAPTPSAPVSAPSPAGEDPRWQKLRDMLGLDGWHDGRFNGLPNPDQIVTHVQHVANERARLLLAPSPAGGVREAVSFMAVIDDAWQELSERDDRTSPEEYPDMCLITPSELAEFMHRAALSSPATPELKKDPA